MLAEIAAEVQKATRDVGDIASDRGLVAGGVAANLLMQRALADESVMKTLLPELGRPMLVKLLASIEGSNRDHKVVCVARLIFKASHDIFRERENQIAIMKNVMTVATRYALVVNYSVDDTLEVSWHLLKKDIMHSPSVIDRALGAADAAAANAMAE